MTSISERVAAGTAWLDENRPGWFNEIDLRRLDLHECCLCVIGQTFGCYASAANPFELDRNVAVEHGFNAPIKGDWWAENERLQDEWVRVITERREAAA